MAEIGMTEVPRAHEKNKDRERWYKLSEKPGSSIEVAESPHYLVVLHKGKATPRVSPQEALATLEENRLQIEASFPGVAIPPQHEKPHVAHFYQDR